MWPFMRAPAPFMNLPYGNRFGMPAGIGGFAPPPHGLGSVPISPFMMPHPLPHVSNQHGMPHGIPLHMIGYQARPSMPLYPMGYHAPSTMAMKSPALAPAQTPNIYEVLFCEACEKEFPSKKAHVQHMATHIKVLFLHPSHSLSYSSVV